MSDQPSPSSETQRPRGRPRSDPSPVYNQTFNIQLPAGHPIMPDGSPAPTFLTEDEFCKLVRCKKRTLQEYRQKRVVRGFMVGRRVMFDLNEAIAFVNSRKQTNPA